MKKIFFMILVGVLTFFCFKAFGESFSDDYVHDSKLVWDLHPNADGDLDKIRIYAKEAGTTIVRREKPYIDIAPDSVELILKDSNVMAELVLTEGKSYDLCVSAVDYNQNESKCMGDVVGGVVTYFFDLTPPSAISGVKIQ